jgi:hypothetical protein
MRSMKQLGSSLPPMMALTGRRKFNCWLRPLLYPASPDAGSPV